eukprot:2643607-Pyramimonas_sp.AAC.5
MRQVVRLTGTTSYGGYLGLGVGGRGDNNDARPPCDCLLVEPQPGHVPARLRHRAREAAHHHLRPCTAIDLINPNLIPLRFMFKLPNAQPPILRCQMEALDATRNILFFCLQCVHLLNNCECRVAPGTRARIAFKGRSEARVRATCMNSNVERAESPPEGVTQPTFALVFLLTFSLALCVNTAALAAPFPPMGTNSNCSWWVGPMEEAALPYWSTGSTISVTFRRTIVCSWPNNIPSSRVSRRVRPCAALQRAAERTTFNRHALADKYDEPVLAATGAAVL